ncbi:hypothetical protein E4634_09350 [Mangrovimicrobium sediminis]|uniref:Uncharacterized protein n=1 Tax=Mangrovimicrobium sediminis TaxID=2562682 RepID=A0A4Z0M4D1_9GAMM|nr:hypothetical protein [Haliea sp. SAOS-164]TGD74314.1 hypothetical protein E4634_09350 [Haliea sp. SAOS-164]
MYDITRETLDARCHRYRVTRDGAPLGFAAALAAWQEDESFRGAFIDSLEASPFAAFRWETPALSRSLAAREFEYVLLDSPWLDVAPDRATFAAYFEAGEDTPGIVQFANLGGDAQLVVPSPRGPAHCYPHLAAFVRGAPARQVHALWAAVGRVVAAELDARPRWLSTAGGGVAWVHVRLDDTPKYYGHAAYRSAH